MQRVFESDTMYSTHPGRAARQESNAVSEANRYNVNINTLNSARTALQSALSETAGFQGSVKTQSAELCIQAQEKGTRGSTSV